jgi:P27 family predicted phage terminase small subunit
VRSNRPNRNQAKIDRSLGMPVRPAFLSVEACEEWDAQCETLHKLGMLTALDRAVFACYCQAYGRWRQIEESLAKIVIDNTDQATRGALIRSTSGKLVQHPLAAAAREAMLLTMKFSAELGLTPSARSRVRLEPSPHDDDPATKYLS